MKRLTTKTSIMGRKHDLAYGYASIWKKKLSKHYRYDLIEEAVDKLGQFENLEEELGIDLLTLLKANKVYYKHWKEDTEIKVSNEVHFDLTNKCLRIYEYPEDEFGLKYKLFEYGLLWSLRKEDLEDEKED